MTPETSYTDFSALQTMGKTNATITYTTEKKGDSTYNDVTITNTGTKVAFQLHLRALKGKDGDDILPLTFSDNYFELAPGEDRVIHCNYANKDAKGEPYFLLSAWNIDLASSKSGKEFGI